MIYSGLMRCLLAVLGGYSTGLIISRTLCFEGLYMW